MSQPSATLSANDALDCLRLLQAFCAHHRASNHVPQVRSLCHLRLCLIWHCTTAAAQQAGAGSAAMGDTPCCHCMTLLPLLLLFLFWRSKQCSRDRSFCPTDTMSAHTTCMCKCCIASQRQQHQNNIVFLINVFWWPSLASMHGATLRAKASSWSTFGLMSNLNANLSGLTLSAASSRCNQNDKKPASAVVHPPPSRSARVQK